MEIKVLGTGCPKCKALEQSVRNVLSENNITANLEKIEDIVKIMEYGILSTPGLVINGKIVCNGRLPSPAEIKSFIDSNL